MLEDDEGCIYVQSIRALQVFNADFQAILISPLLSLKYISEVNCQCA